MRHISQIPPEELTEGCYFCSDCNGETEHKFQPVTWICYESMSDEAIAEAEKDTTLVCVSCIDRAYRQEREERGLDL